MSPRPEWVFPRRTTKAPTHAGPGRHLRWQCGLSPSVLRSHAVRPHRSSAVEPRGGVACGGVCGMKPACAFGDSSRFHLKDKKGRHEGNDIYVLGKPSCSKLASEEGARTWAVPPPPPGLGASAGPPAWQQDRLHPSAQGHPHLHLPQDGNTSLCAHRNGERKTVSGREGAYSGGSVRGKPRGTWSP